VGCEPYGDGATVVLCGRESRPPGEGWQVSGDPTGEEREMRSAETVLGIIQERGKRGLPLEDVYRQLFNPNLYLLAYGRIYRNRGAMTSGATGETVDGMSLAKIEAIIAALHCESYRWTPGAAGVHCQEKLGQATPAGCAHLVGQTAARSNPSNSGGVLRVAVQPDLTWFSPQPRLSHGAA
jgi:hypothetical protein